jgi:hypothetical protein
MNSAAEPIGMPAIAGMRIPSSGVMHESPREVRAAVTVRSRFDRTEWE